MIHKIYLHEDDKVIEVRVKDKDTGSLSDYWVLHVIHPEQREFNYLVSKKTKICRFFSYENESSRILKEYGTKALKQLFPEEFI